MRIWNVCWSWIQSNFKELILPIIICGILVSFLGNFLWQTYIEYKDINKTLRVKSISIENVPFILNGNVLGDDILPEQKYNFSNYIQNTLKVQNDKQNRIIVDEIKLTNVQVDETYSFTDILVHYGLSTNSESQPFKVFVFNNGNSKDASARYQIDFIKYNYNTKKSVNILSNTSDVILDGGDIKELFKKELQSSEIMAAFEDYTEGDNLQINIRDLNSGKKEPTVHISYDNKTKRFNISAGSSGPSNDTTRIPKFNISSPYKTEYTKKIAMEVDSGESTIPFHLLFDKTVRVEYDIEIKSDGNKVEWTSGKRHQIVAIHMPVYKINKSNLYGMIYLYCEEYKLSNSTFEEVKSKDKKLIYTVDNTIEDYNLYEKN